MGASRLVSCRRLAILLIFCCAPTALLSPLVQAQTVAPLFEARRDATLGGPIHTPPAIADMNEDGYGDVVTAASDVHGIVVQIGDGSGGVQPWTSHALGQTIFVKAVTVGDFNEDNHRDVAVLAQHSAPPFANEGQVFVLLGDGLGQFTLTYFDLVYDTQPYPQMPIVAARMNGDLHIDLVLLCGRIVFLGQGNGSFTRLEDPDAGIGNSFVVADFNRDLRQDIAASGSNVVSFGNGAGTFAPSLTLPLGVPTIAIASGDFDEDGDQDLAFARDAHEEIRILFSRGDGAFDVPPLIVPIPERGYVLACGHVTADAHLDLLVTRGSPADAVDVLAGSGGGMFTRIQSTVSFIGNTIACGKLDSDARDDVLVGGISIYLARGEGLLSARPFPTGDGPQELAVGDFVEDGAPDVVVANVYGNSVTLLKGDGQGNLESGTPIPVGTNPWSVAAGDFTGDHHLDLAVANFNGQSISLLTGNGAGGLVGITPLTCPSRPSAIELVELNEDQLLDLVTSLFDMGAVEVRLGSGQGGFGQPAIFDIPGSTVDVLIAELTGDAHLDVAAVSNEGTVSVLRGDGAGGLIPGAEIAFHRLAWKLAAGLVTGDAIPDLVVSGEQEYLWPGVGNGQFGTPYSLEVIGESAGVVIAEMTGDGRNDVAFTVGGLNGVAVRARSGNEFAPGEIYGSGRLPVDVVAVDLDLDGRMDLVTADRTSDMIDVLLSVLPPTTGIPPVTAPARFVLGPTVPNPLVRGLPVRISIGEPSGLAWARVYDVSGRFIANLGHEPGLLTWDGRGVDGRPVPAGEYVVAVDGTRGQATCKLLVIP